MNQYANGTELLQPMSNEHVCYYIIEGVPPWGKAGRAATWIQDVRPTSFDQPANLRSAWMAMREWERKGYTRVTINEVVARPAVLDPADVARWTEAERLARETWERCEER